ncbi:MAG: PPOX class F420-dependent oxidoreductase [Thermomicrobiales bacterium]|nr:PPOX class F420-dependent oxidoreductase [Thermomicrobiales bacterium]
MSEHSVIPASHQDLLDSTALADIATIGPDGSPQVNPVWFGWDGKRVSFSQTKARQKYRNLHKDNRIALSIVDPANPYRYMEIRGKVVEFIEDPDKAFIDSMAKKYLEAG